MTEKENVQTIQQSYHLFRQGDLQGMLANITPDGELIYPGEKAAISFAGTHRGPDEIAQYFMLNGSLLDFQRLDLKEFVAQGDKVVVLGTAYITARQTGKRIVTDFAHVFTLHEGKIAKYQVFDDSAQVAAALA